MREKPNYSLDIISSRSGFGSRTTFYKAFYSQKGVTPNQYRSQQTEE